MMCDDREIPLEDFEQDILEELLSMQRQMAGGLVESVASKKVTAFPGRRRQALVAGLAAAAALVGGSFALATQHPDAASATPALPHPLPFVHGSRALAVASLNHAADAQDATQQGSGSVAYAETQNYSLQTTVSSHRSTSVVETTLRKVWRSATGHTVVREYRQDTEPAGGDVGGPRPLGSVDHSGSYAPGGWADPNVGFPTTTAGASAALSDPATEGSPSLTAITMAYEIGEHLSVGTATPAQTAVLYRLLADLPGVFYAGSVTDNAGRAGQAVGIVTSGAGSLVTGTEYFVFNPGTGAFLESEIVDTPDAPPALHLPPGPTVEQYEVVLAGGRVSSTGLAARSGE